MYDNAKENVLQLTVRVGVSEMVKTLPDTSDSVHTRWMRFVGHVSAMSALDVCRLQR